MKKVLAFLISFVVGFSVLATTPASYTAQLTKTTSQTPESYNRGEEYTQYFEITTDTIVTNGSVLALALIPAQSRIIGGEIELSASGTTSTNTLGVIAADGSGYYSLDGSTDADDTDAFLAAFSSQAQVNDGFAKILDDDLNAALTVEKAVFLVLDGAAGAAAYPTNETIKGVVRYIR